MFFDPGIKSVFEFNKFFLPQDTCQQGTVMQLSNLKIICLESLPSRQWKHRNDVFDPGIKSVFEFIKFFLSQETCQ